MENAGYCFIMLVATSICAYIPAANVLNRRLSLRGDVLFLLFWYQSWIYLHVVPTINCLFPDSWFAYPPGFEDMRVIQFTSEDIGWYAVLQVLILLLFFMPLMFVYRCFKRKMAVRRIEPLQPRKTVDSTALILLSLSYSFFGLMFYEMATRTGMVSPYGTNIDVLAGLSRYDHWVWRIYLVTNPFLFTTILMAFFERDRRVSIIPPLLAFVPGAVFNAAWVFSSSRSSLVFITTGVIGALMIRGHIRRLTKRQFYGMAASALLIWYGLNVIPTVRGVVLQDSVSADDLFVALNPFNDNGDLLSSRKSDIGFRLDGLELMALASPRMLDIGPAFNYRYPLAILAPVTPIVPSLERALKFDDRKLDFKKYYMARYTDIQLTDYSAGALVDIFMFLGPLGFLVAAVTYGYIFAWITRLISVPTAKRSIILGIFFYYSISLYEFSFASVLLGWVRGLPVLLVALAFNPFRYGITKKLGGVVRAVPYHSASLCLNGTKTTVRQKANPRS